MANPEPQPSIDSFRPKLRKSLEAFNLPPAELDRIIAGLSSAFETPAPARHKLVEKGLNDGKYYIVKDEDFDVVRTAAKAISKVLAGEKLDAIVALVGGLVGYWQKRGVFGKATGQVALALKKAGEGGATADELVMLVKGDKLDADKVTASLVELRDSKRGDLAACGFVELRADGRWYPLKY